MAASRAERGHSQMSLTTLTNEMCGMWLIGKSVSTSSEKLSTSAISISVFSDTLTTGSLQSQFFFTYTACHLGRVKRKKELIG